MNNKIKVCFISRSAYPLFNPNCKATFGGAEIDLYIISKVLAEDISFDVSFIAGDFGQKNKEYYENVKVYKSYRFRENKIIQMIKFIVRIIKTNADIYIQENASGGTGIISLVCLIFNRKFIYRTASDIDCDGTFIKNNFIEGIFYKWGLKYASVIITQNELNKIQIKKYLNFDSVVIKNGIEIPKKTQDIKNSILWVARSEKLKQPYIFLDIAREFPQEKFIMICPEANYNSIDISDLKNKIKGIPNIEFIPYVPFREINNYYINAKMFINTSTYEGFPNTFIQSLINAVPIFTLNVDPDSFITKNKCGVCAGGNLKMLILEIKKTLNNHDIWKSYSENAYMYALENNDIRNLIHKYKEILTKL